MAFMGSVSAITTPISTEHLLCSEHSRALIHMIPPRTLASPGTIIRMTFISEEIKPEKLGQALKVEVTLLRGIKAGFGCDPNPQSMLPLQQT